jgi:hypothetical protein
MANDLAISEVARVSGLRTSAIRYYEQIGIFRGSNSISTMAANSKEDLWQQQ